LGILAYIIINLLLFSSWYAFLFNKKDVISFLDRVIGATVLSLTQIITTELLLGLVFRKLHALPLFSLNIFISSTVLIISLVKVRIPNLSSAFIHINLIYEELRDKISRFTGIVKGDRILIIIFCLFSLSLCWMMFIGYLFPSYTWDALWYHLPIVGYIMQNGAIQEIANNSFIEQFINIFPKNIELLFLWNIIFLKSDILTDLTQMVFAFMGVLTVCSLAIKLKVSERNAIYSGLLFFFTPIMILQSTTNYVDIAISVLFLVALNFLLSDGVIASEDSELRRINEKRRKLFLLFGGLSSGILLGSKGSGPLFIVILSALVIIQKIRKHFVYTRNQGILKEYKNLQSVKSFIIFFALPAILMGGYWYMKNWVLYNNPVYPMEISLFGKIFFKGLYKEMIEPVPEIITRLSFVSRPVYVWLEHVEYYLYDSRLSGLGPVWFILYIPGIAFSLLHAVKNRKYDFLAVAAIIMAGFFLYPRNWTPRYVMFIVGLGALSFGYTLNYFNERDNVLRSIALLLVVYTFFAANSPCVTPARIKHFINLPANERTVARHAPFNIDLHARQEYGHWIWISDNIRAGETLTYTFEPLFLSPLWNSGFTSFITFVKAETYNEWLKDLEQKKATYVLVRSKSKEDKWVEASYSLKWMGMKERFKVEYADDNYKIMRFIK
jgi:hypothetical protein